MLFCLASPRSAHADLAEDGPGLLPGLLRQLFPSPQAALQPLDRGQEFARLRLAIDHGDSPLSLTAPTDAAYCDGPSHTRRPSGMSIAPAPTGRNDQFTKRSRDIHAPACAVSRGGNAVA